MQMLRVHHRLPAGELLRLLGISRPTLMRAVRANRGEVLTVGRGKRTSYAARRHLRGQAAALPLFRIDEQGQSSEVGRLHLAYPDGCVVEGEALNEWPLDADMRDGWHAGLPYPLQDLRPDGFLGRAFARAHTAMLQVPPDPRHWSDDDALHALSLLGSDQSGCFIIGEPAYRLWQAQAPARSELVADHRVDDAYAALAEQAMGLGVATSSAAGEFPKFSAVRQSQGRTFHVLVKFSGSDRSPGTRRWSDLLVCEHLALQTARQVLGLKAAQSVIYQSAQGRTFLEVERFDRHGALGRSLLCSWAALNHALFGLGGKPWIEGATQLLQRGFIQQPAAEAIALQHFYGHLIANTDMHDGNLSFVPVAGQVGMLEVAPVYDMLPMHYAPQRGVELADKDFTPQLPLPSQRPSWSVAAQAAIAFWQAASQDRRISAGFRKVCARNAEVVRGLAARG